MKNDLKVYINLVNFLGDMLGENTEVVLHDLSNSDNVNNTIIAIKNGHISGRVVGGPVTDLLLDVIHDRKHKDKNYLCNYKSQLKNGKVIKSSTFFIKDSKDKVIGALCINTNCEDLYTIKNIIDKLLPVCEEGNEEDQVSERLNLNADELTLENIQKVVDEVGISPERMSHQEKVETVRRLHEMGIFLLKGAVTQTAEALKISEPSVYRYINQIKRMEAI